MVLEADGVWDQHCDILLEPGQGFRLQACPGALTRLNGTPVEGAPLRNGDLIELGSARVRFWLAPMRQRRLWPREALTWVALTLLFALQIFLIYSLSDR